MKALLVGLMMFLLSTSAALADTVTLVFTDPNTPVATSYSFAQRAEGVTAWTAIPAASVTTTCTGTVPNTVCSSVVTGIASTGTILFQYSLTTTSGSATRFKAGGWYCGNCGPVSATATGIQ